MTYVKTTWVNDEAPDVDADHLNHLEQGVSDAHDLAGAASAASATASGVASATAASLSAHAADSSNPHATTSKQAGGRHHKNAKKRGLLKTNGYAANGVILQALLDEIRVAGGGELYIPGDEGDIFDTYCLWVPPKCRIVSDGAQLRALANSPDARNQTQETFPNPIYADHALFISSQRLADPAIVYPSGITIEGLTILGSSTNGSVAIQTGSEITFRDFVCEKGTNPVEHVAIINRQGATIESVLFERCRLTGGRRNVMSADGYRYLTLVDCTLEGCTGDNTLDPGMGLDAEAEGTSRPQTALKLIRCIVRNNAGAGVGLMWDHSGNLVECGDALIDGCTIIGNGAKAGMFSGYGGVRFKGGKVGGGAAAKIVNSTITGNLLGNSIDGATNLALIVVNNDLRPVAGKSAIGVTGYDAGRSTLTPNITS